MPDEWLTSPPPTETGAGCGLYRLDMLRGWSLLLLGLALACVFGWSEVEHARSSRRRFGPDAGGAGGVVVALGVRNRGRRANLLNRYRVHVALRSRRGDLSRARLIFSGGPTSPGRPPEAMLMAEYARSLGVPAESIEVETASRTMWENVLNVTPMLESADRIVFASNALHAEKARAYLWKQRPDLARRLARADDYRIGELLALKPLLACIGLRNLRRLDRG